MGFYGIFNGILIGLNGFLWYLWNLIGFNGILMGLNGILWYFNCILMGLNGILWYLMEFNRI